MPGTNLQNSIDFGGQNFYVGLDVHKKSWVVIVSSLGSQAAQIPIYINGKNQHQGKRLFYYIYS